MTGSYYLDILIVCVAGPILLSFDKKVFFIRRWREVVISIAVCVLLLGSYDIYAFGAGFWVANPQAVFPAIVLGLPWEEVLFFILIPYAVLFSYEVLNVYFPKVRLSSKAANTLSWILIGVFLVLAMLGRSGAYTWQNLVLAAALTGFFRIVHQAFLPPFFRLLLAIIPLFVVTNGLLTGSFGPMPIFIYNPEHICGIRLMQIPLEDFVFNYNLVLLITGTYSYVRYVREKTSCNTSGERRGNNLPK